MSRPNNWNRGTVNGVSLLDRKLDALLGTVDEDIPTADEATERWQDFVSRLSNEEETL